MNQRINKYSHCPFQWILKRAQASTSEHKMDGSSPKVKEDEKSVDVPLSEIRGNSLVINAFKPFIPADAAEGEEEVFVNDWLEARGESFTIRGRLLKLVRITFPFDEKDMSRRPGEYTTFTTGSDETPWKPVEIDFTYGRNTEDGGRQFRPKLRYMDRSGTAYDVCQCESPENLAMDLIGEYPKGRKSKMLILVLDTYDQYVSPKCHHFCARAVVEIRDAGHRNKAHKFFDQYANMQHAWIRPDTRYYPTGELPRHWRAVRYGEARMMEESDVRYERERYRTMLSLIDQRVTEIAQSEEYK